MKHAYSGDLSGIETITSNEIPIFTQINDLLRVGKLDVTIEDADGEEILARHKNFDDPYSIAQMSDGERNAVILAANVLTVETGTVLLVDEPERHMHRSIIVPLLSALFGLRDDCAFIVSTHETELPLSNPDAQTLMTRSCAWAGNRASAWDVEPLDQDLDLPDDLKRSILGSRKFILFVEGQDQSSDKSLYESLFPGISVIAKGTSHDVIDAVRGLRNSADLHHTEAFGLIDRDFRDDVDIARLAKDYVFALDVYSVESLYYCSIAIDAVAQHQSAFLNLDMVSIRRLATTKAMAAVTQDTTLAERMAARRSQHVIRSLVQSQLPDWKSVRDTGQDRITIEIDSPYNDELRTFNSLVDDENLDALIARYPIRESNVIKAIVDALQISRENYQRLLPTLVRNDPLLAYKLKLQFKSLADALA